MCHPTFAYTIRAELFLLECVSGLISIFEEWTHGKKDVLHVYELKETQRDRVQTMI